MSDPRPAILPGSALTVDKLRERLEGQLTSWRRPLREEAENLLCLLALYPWQQYDYKLGRWERVVRLNTTFGNETRWGRAYDTMQVLMPSTGPGQAVGELQAELNIELPAPRGSVLIAGNPSIAAAYSPVGDGSRSVHLVFSPFLPKEEALNWIAALGSTGAAPEPLPSTYSETFPYSRSTWLVDRRRRPKRSDGYTWTSIDDPKKVPRGTRSMKLTGSWRWRRASVQTRRR